MACQNCYDNCIKGTTSDKCVQYTGEDNTALSIEQGDSLYSVLTQIINSLDGTFSGKDITLDSVGTACTFFNDIMSSQDLTVENVIKALVTAVCMLYTDVTDIQEIVDAPISISASCLTLPTTPSRDDILKAAVAKLCDINTLVNSINTTVNTINSGYVKKSELCSLVTACLASTTPGVVQEYTKMPKYSPIPYVGPLSVFDSTGKGLASAGYDKVYLCLGQSVNGFTLPDSRGRSPMGVNSGVPTSGMDNTVNPALAANSGYTLANKQKLGSYTHTLTIAEEAPHTHTITDPGHDHSMGGHFADAGDDNNYNLFASSGSQKTLKSTTGISINSVGGGQAHNNLSPVFGCYFMIYIPS